MNASGYENPRVNANGNEEKVSKDCFAVIRVPLVLPMGL
jgi:hypothetical protein